jgi:hypothetical protein
MRYWSDVDLKEHMFSVTDGKPEQAGSSFNASDLHLWGSRFESRTEHRLSWLLKVLRGFLSPSRQMLR